MSVTSPVSKRQLRAKKLQRLKDTHYKQLLQGVTVIEQASKVIREFASEYREDADVQLQAMQTRLDTHLSKTSRAHVNFKPHPNKRWTVAFGDDVFELGPLPDFEHIDDEEPHYYWAGSDGVRHPSMSLFMALMGIVQEYHNAERVRPPTDTGPVST